MVVTTSFEALRWNESLWVREIRRSCLMSGGEETWLPL